MIDSRDYEMLKQEIKKMEDELGVDSGDVDINKILKDAGIELDLKKIEDEMMNPAIPKFTLGYRVIHPDTVEPKYNYPTDSGFDLHSTEDLEIGPFGRALVPTGLKVDIPEGTEIQVRPKSGLAIKQGLTVLNTPGTVDQGYTGEIQVIVFNTNNYIVTIPKGMKVAQAVLCPVLNGGMVNLQLVSEVGNKDRGNNGFGSTGI